MKLYLFESTSTDIDADGPTRLDAYVIAPNINAAAVLWRAWCRANDWGEPDDDLCKVESLPVPLAARAVPGVVEWATVEKGTFFVSALAQ